MVSEKKENFHQTALRIHDNFLDFSPTSSHLHPLQVENCNSNSRLVVDKDDNGKFRLERALRAKLPLTTKTITPD